MNSLKNTKSISFLLLLFISLLSSYLIYRIYMSSKCTSSWDSFMYLPTATSMVEGKGFKITEWKNNLNPDIQGIFRDEFFIFEREGEVYNYFPFGNALLLTPLVYYITPEKIKNHYFDHYKAQKKISAPLAALTALILFWLTQLMYKNISLSLFAFFAFSLGSMIFSTAAVGMWQHGPGLFFTCLSLLCLFVIELNKERLRLRWLIFFELIAGLTSGFAIIVRPLNFITMVAFLLLLIILRNFRGALLYCLGLACMAYLLFYISLQEYGTLLPPYFLGNANFKFFSFDSMLAYLISPGRGIFVYFPLFFLIFFSIPALLRGILHLTLHKISFKELAICMSWGLVFVHFFVLSSYNTPWHAGFSFGPRLWVESMPFISLLCIEGYIYLRTRAWLKGLKLHFFHLLILVALSWGVFVHTVGAFFPSTMQWNLQYNENGFSAKMWNWNHPQFFEF